MKVDSRTVTVAVAGLLLTAALGVLAGKTVGAVAGALAALAGLVASAVVSVVLERQSRHAAEAARNQELLEMFAPPRPISETVSPGEGPGRGVARYLRAEERVVPFRGRPELDELLAWCGAGGHVRV